MRIVRGENVESKSSIPSIVSLYHRSGDKFDHHCGASIINEKCIVTAAHCVSDKDVGNYQVLFGTKTLSQDAKRLDVSTIIAHPVYDYKSSNMTADIAVIVIKENFIYNDEVRNR